MNTEGWPGIDHAASLLKAGAHALDIVEQSIRLTEENPNVHTVSIGSPPNALGVMQLDASFMNGNTLQVGAIGAIENCIHPISVARQVMERLPHVMLVGEGARLFANECGFSKDHVLNETTTRDYESWRAKHFQEPLISMFTRDTGKGAHGTVICLVIDSHGNFGGGISTSGWDYKYPGRLGDSPIIGAGLYIDQRYGGAACTHCGENAIRTALAHSVVLYMKKGARVEEAVREGMEDLNSLKEGYLGQVFIYAFDKDGVPFVAQKIKREDDCGYLIFQEGMSGYEKRRVASA
jgi:L-asparaginase